VPEPAGAPPFTSADGVRFEVEALDAERWQRFWARLAAQPRAVSRGWRPFQQRFATATCPLPPALHRAAAGLAYADIAAAAAAAGVSVLPLRPPPDGTAADPPWRFAPLASASLAGTPQAGTPQAGTPQAGTPQAGAAVAGAAVTGAAVAGAAMAGAELTAADMTGAAVAGAAVTGAPVSGAEMTATDMTGAAVTGAAVAGADMTGAAVAGAVVALPLDGVVVVEVGRRVQGPLAGHLLRLLGARVIRVEPPGGDPMRGVPPTAGDCSARFLALNRGKQVVEADLRTVNGQRAVRELVTGADAFLHNLAPGKAAELAVEASDLAALRPGLVYAHASGWGDALGPRPPLGTDYLVQAHSGLAALLSPAGRPPAPSLMTITDILGGAVCALGVLAGLLTRYRTGHGLRVETSLLSAATLLHQPAAPPSAAPPSAAPPSAAPPAALPPAALPSAAVPAAVPASGSLAVEVCTDLRVLAGDPRFAAALEQEGCAVPCAPWEFR
jgi:hypothetical protein